jgi:hypothetical protein
MCGLDVLRMIVSPCASHSFGIPVVGDDVVVVRELFETKSSLSVLLDNLAIQEFPHLGR